MSLNDLEAQQRKLKLEREIAWLQREKSALAFLAKCKWPAAIAIGGFVLLVIGLNIWDRLTLG